MAITSNEQLNNQGILNRINRLKNELTGDMFTDMQTRDEIHKLEMQLNNTKPLDSKFECEGCGS